MLGPGRPSLRAVLEPVLGDDHLTVIDRQEPVEGKPYRDKAAPDIVGYAVPVAPDIDIAVPGGKAPLVVRGIVADRGHGVQGRCLTQKAFLNDLLHGPVKPSVRFPCEP